MFGVQMEFGFGINPRTNIIDQEMLDVQRHTNTNCILMVLKVT